MLATLVLLFAAEGVSPRQATLDVQDHLESKLPKLPTFDSPEAWRKYADKLRDEVREKVMLRGEAAKWAKLPVKPEFAETITAEGCTVQKLRYEVVPGMWIQALLYTPKERADKMPVMLAVNGHDRVGKAVDYKQIRCLNLARRGLIVLNLEWFGMGQLNQPGNNHGSLNQIDLCGSSGLAPFYLSMSRGLDILLSRPGADPARVCVSGLSGGGWQTITISSLDPRVTLANPVAGYSGFKVKIRDHLMDLGDSEQTPCDLGTLADYTHLTCFRAPRPTLLTYNAKDRCCFTADHALPPLLEAAGPVYKLLGKPENLRSHINHDPGDHNYGKDNRQQLYRAVGDYFYPGDKKFSADEIDVSADVKKPEQLLVEVPKDNLTLNTLALKLAKDLPRADIALETRRERVRSLLRLPNLKVTKTGEGFVRLSDKWTVPLRITETVGAEKTALVLNDAGFAADKKQAIATRLAKEGYRVIEMDPWYFGASKLTSHDYLFALLLGCVGDRPLGLQAAEVNAVAGWAKGGVHVVAVGPRTGLIALAAAAVDGKAVASLELQGGRASLKEVLEENRVMQQVPETFCFGLLEVADVKQLIQLAAPRTVTFVDPGERHAKELGEVKNYRAAKGAK